MCEASEAADTLLGSVEFGTRDHETLDLAGALVDLSDLGITEVAFDRQLFAVSHARA